LLGFGPRSQRLRFWLIKSRPVSPTNASMIGSGSGEARLWKTSEWISLGWRGANPEQNVLTDIRFRYDVDVCKWHTSKVLVAAGGVDSWL